MTSSSRYVDLTALADGFRTDKGSIDGDRHLYTELYAAFFESFRLTKFNLLEMGLLPAPNRTEEADPANRRVARIPSVEMWLEFFPQARVYGFDLADFSGINLPRFTFVRGDLSEDADIYRLAKAVPQPRIIIDDASHASFHQQRAFLELFPVLEPGGFYVIEDLHYSPPFESSLPPCRKMTEVVQEYLDTGSLRLDFGPAQDAKVLTSQIAHTFMHCSARGRPGWGPKLVIFQKAFGTAAAAVAVPAPEEPWLNAGWLSSRSFSFRATSPDRKISNALRFAPNGRITGYKNSNEVAWRIEDGRLVVLRADGLPSCIATPQLNADATASLVGPFIGAAHINHCFDEIRTQSILPEVYTFDLFDTLVARRCFDPVAIFRNVELQSGVKDFAKLRHTLEAELWRQGDYNFDDIYRVLREHTGWPKPLLDRLRMMELAEEWDNLFPIAEMVACVGPNDMIVSDMYLPFDFLRRLVDETCGLPGRPIHVSSHGKSRGEIWPKLRASYAIRRHYGDNLASDVQGVRRAGLEAEQVTVSSWTRGEQILREAGMGTFASALREARLTHYDPNPLLYDAAQAQFQLNLPLLILASVAVLKQAAAEKIDTLLMCARDCNLWQHLVRMLAARSPAAPMVRYLLSSRVLLLSGSAEYRAYVDAMSGKRSLIVDVSGTGRSPAHFIGTSDRQSNTGIFLIVANAGVANFVQHLAPARADVRMDVLSWSPNEFRIPIESLNMSLEHRAKRMEFTGHKFAAITEPNEFGEQSRALIGAMRKSFFAGIKLMERDFHRFPENITADKVSAAVGAVIALVPDFRSVTAPIIGDINRQEQHIAAMAKEEQQYFTARKEACQEGSKAAVEVPREAIG